MFGFHTRIGYQNIDESIPSPQSDRASERTPLIAEGTSASEVDAPSDVYGGPPLEHGIAADEQRLADSHAASSSGVLWDRVENLDQFFTRVYEYHQNVGYLCIVVKHILTLLQFIFVVWFVTFLLTRVDYDVLFKKTNVTATGEPITGKIRFKDVVYPDWSRMGIFTICLIACAVFFWIFRATRVFYQIYQFGEIRTFYHSALRIEDASLSNLKWPEVVQLICEKQPSIHLILNKDGITALDLYQRILRHKNYFVALINKEILPPVINVPFLGPMPYLPNGLKTNLEWLLFYGMWSPWKGPYELKDEYKHPQNTFRLADELSSAILKMAIINFIFFPLIFIYQLLYFFFTYGELLKRDPSSFAMRRYSNYGRSKLRHFNELDHELRMRLSRSHRAATQYMEQFSSPLLQVIARKLQFVAGAICIVLLLLGAWDEDTLTVEHVFTIVSICAVIVVACQGFIADENMIYWPETLLNMVIAQIHYAPDSWKGKAHTDTVRKEFGQLFQLKAQFILEELLSPILTPFILLFWIRPKAKDIVDFFHSFTVSVEGLGDVCSFAQMDIGRHGDPTWSFDSCTAEVMRQKVHANDGKTELSLIHFASNHPEWKPPPRAGRFLDELRERMEHDMTALKEGIIDDNILFNSLHSFHPLPYQQHQLARKPKGRQPIAASLYGPDLWGGAAAAVASAQISFHDGRKDLPEMDVASQSVALSIAYLRGLRAQSESMTLPGPQPPQIPAPAVNLTPSRCMETTTGDVWSVPAQSAIVSPPGPAAPPIPRRPSRTEDNQRQGSTDEPPPPGLSDHLLDV